jgi:hypothetical protein
MIIDARRMSRTAFEQGTGWALKPQGACRGEICVPLPDETDPDTVDVAAVAQRLGMPLVTDDATGVAALGPASVTGRVLGTAEAPELVLPDLDGVEFALSSLRGQKVVLVAWAPY